MERCRIDERLAKGESWEKVAGFCASHCQSDALGLMPWQSAPLWFANHLETVLSEPYGDASGRREAGEILQRLLRNGLSKFEPIHCRQLPKRSRRGRSRQRSDQSSTQGKLIGGRNHGLTLRHRTLRRR